MRATANTLDIQRLPGDALILRYSGPLNSETVSGLWKQSIQELDAHPPARLSVDASGVTYCDGSGIGLFLELSLRARRGNFPMEINGLRPDISRLFDLHKPALFENLRSEPPRLRVVASIGLGAVELGRDILSLIAFLGEFLASVLQIIRRPRRMRWKEIPLTIERAGADAVWIVGLLGFLFGVTLAFSAALPLSRYGGELYVADLSALALTRVLGPVLAAIILAGRSGSAFAAELGTMKINSELDALRTMTLDPVPFLVMPKVIASIIVSPLLTILANITGLLGTAVVLQILGFSFSQFAAHVKGSVSHTDIFVGLGKPLFYGLFIGAISCLRGLQAGSDPKAVGTAATRAVVGSIVLIIIGEGIFSIILHYLNL